MGVAASGRAERQLGPAEDDGIDFRVRLAELNEELEKLNAEAAILQERIAVNVAELRR